MSPTTGRGDPDRPAIAITMADPERSQVEEVLIEAGFDTIPLPPGASIAEAFPRTSQRLVALIDVAGDPDSAANRVKEARRGHANRLSVLFLASEDELDPLAAADLDPADEIVLRPWSVEAIRWRVEAMAIRAQVPTTEGGDAVLAGGNVGAAWTPSAPVFAVFNPKGGVGKTTIATNLAAVLQSRKKMDVLLLDADTVTGHVGLSLGMPEGRSAADSWVDEDAGYTHETLLDIAEMHSSGIKVVALSTNPLTHGALKPEKVADAINEARHTVEAVVVDLHPSYSEVNLGVFAIADRILVPVTPDLPAMRAAIQLKEVAIELGVRERLSMIINRANSGVTVADMEETVGLPAIAHIRSAGLHFVWSANAGMTLIDKFPKHPVAQDFEHLASRLLAINTGAPLPQRKDVGILKGLFSRKAISQA